MVLSVQTAKGAHGVVGEQESAPHPFAWTRALYQQLAGAGILHEDDHVELIEGESAQMAAKRHTFCR